jgi:hypothetical protein
MRADKVFRTGGGRAALTLLLWCAAGAVAAACPICFQVEDEPARAGVLAGVWVLLGLTVVVLGGVVRFAWRLIGK